MIGAFLLVVGIVLGVLQVAWRDDRRSILLAAAFLSLAFFVLPTRVHERYLFPIFVLLPLLAITSRRWLVATVVLAAASFMNLHAILTLPLYATPNIADLLGGPAFRSETGVALSALGHVAVFLLALSALAPVRWILRRGRPEEPARDAQPGSRVAPGASGGPGPSPATAGLSAAPPVPPGTGGETRPWSSAAAEPGGGTPGEPGGVVAGDLSPAFPEAGSLAAGAAGSSLAADWMPRPPARWSLGALRGLLGPGSIRADRSRLLHGEGGGRIDRLDMLVMALLVVAAMTGRTWRVAQPYGMYFDEVYHARTATEFLQDWRYGMPHAIYEFTHPHLAKYLMAVGIVAFGDDKVTGTSDLGVPVRSTAIEPRWIDPGISVGRDGDRLYVATGSEVLAYDLQSRGVVAKLAVPGATAVAVDTFQHVLYAAGSDGSIWSLPTSRLDALRTGGQGTAGIQPTRLAGSGAGAPVQRLVPSTTGAQPAGRDHDR